MGKRFDQLLMFFSATAVLVAVVLALPVALKRRGDLPSEPVRLVTQVDTAMILFLASTCGACRSKPGQQSIASLKRVLNGQGNFHFVGVAMDVSIDSGLDILAAYGSFDEISIGHGWLNTMLVKHVWTDPGGMSVVPQLLIVERAFDVRDPTPGSVAIAERLIERAIGLDAIASSLSKYVLPE